MKKDNHGPIGHIPPADANIFSELGFDEAESQLLAQEAEKEVLALLAIKQQLMQEISDWIDENKLKQADVAAKLNISRPRVSDVVNQKTSKFTVDALITMLGKLGKPVTVTVG